MFKKYFLWAVAVAFIFSPVASVDAGGPSHILRGYILLQVESHGEAWYVNTEDGFRYYMRDGGAAYAMLREFGLGITNADLKKIPVGVNDKLISVHDPDEDRDGLGNKTEESLGTNPLNIDTDGDGFTDGQEVRNGYNPLGAGVAVVDAGLVKYVQGKILLQVESHGEAWYVNPVDGRRYYMANGEMAYDVMRYLSLGITNADLEKIPTQELTLPASQTSVSAAVIECDPLNGQCFIDAARTCSPARQTWTEIIGVSGITEKITYIREIQGLENGLCRYFHRYINTTIELDQTMLNDPSSTPEEVAEIEKEFQEIEEFINTQFANTEGVCRAKTDELVYLFEGMEILFEIEPTDYNCSGSYYAVLEAIRFGEIDYETSAYTVAQQRDAERIADIKQIQTALELYYNDQGLYPTGEGVLGVGSMACLTSSGWQSSGCSGGTIYMGLVPINPTPGGSSYFYSFTKANPTAQDSYTLTFTLEEGVMGLSAGGHIANMDGIQ